MGNSTGKERSRKAAIDKPPKPYEGFPLGPANNGCWQKKILGKIRYFGRWGRIVKGKMVRLPGDGWKEALDKFNSQKEDLYAGREPRDKGEGLTIGDLCNRFLTGKKLKHDAGEMSAGAFREYNLTTDRLVVAYGKGRLVDDLASEDFEGLRAELADIYGPVRLGNEIQKVRTVFKYGYEAGLMDKPVRFGPDFKKPSASVIRKHKAANGEQMFEAAEIQLLLKTATPAWKAMILLGVNCGLGNTDCGTLLGRHLNLDDGWLDFPRPKTGIPRRCPLWDETVDALREAIEGRPVPSSEEHAQYVFLNSHGKPWAQDGAISKSGGDEGKPVTYKASAPLNSLARGFRKLLDTVEVYRKGLGFYTLRHVFRTIADGCGDQVAVNAIMGHVDPSMGAVYRERIDDSRLLAAVEYVHAWLWPETPDAKPDDDIADEQANPMRPNRARAANSTSDERPQLRIVG